MHCHNFIQTWMHFQVFFNACMMSNNSTNRNNFKIPLPRITTFFNYVPLFTTIRKYPYHYLKLNAMIFQISGSSRAPCNCHRTQSLRTLRGNVLCIFSVDSVNSFRFQANNKTCWMCFANYVMFSANTMYLLLLPYRINSSKNY